MTKRPEVVAFASKHKLTALNDFSNVPMWTADVNCLTEPDPDLFYSEFAKDIAKAKEYCNSGCPMLEECLAYGMKHENVGVWGGKSAKERFVLRGNKEAFQANDIVALLNEAKFILNTPADQVAEYYEVDTRTVARWRNTIRQAQKAS